MYVGVNSLQTIKSRFQKRSPEKWADEKERSDFLNNLGNEWEAWNQTGESAFNHILMNDGALDDAVDELEQVVFSQFGYDQPLMPIDQYGNYQIRQPEY